MEEKIEITWSDGSICSATLVEIEQSVEHWSKLTLSDGTELRVKPIITEVARVKDKYDAENNPIYSLKHQIVATVFSTSNNFKKNSNNA